MNSSALPTEPAALSGARWSATLALLGGLLLTAATLSGESPAAVARHAALGAMLSLLAFAALEVRRDWNALLRADLVCMAALYYLLFVEFLFPQPDFDLLATDEAALEHAVWIVVCGMCALALGRHFVGARLRRWRLVALRVPPSSLLGMLWVCFAIGYLHMLVAVDFNPFELVAQFLEPRFEAAWARPQFGDLDALLYELGATLYLVPPIAGMILGHRERHSPLAVGAVAAALLFTLFYGFTTGTRSVIGAYLATFLVAYFYTARSRRRIVPVAALALALMLASTIYGLEFRNIGLRAYLAEGPQSGAPVAPSFYVDYNLLVVAELTGVFPQQHSYLGWEVPKWLLVRVVPRALWPGKPDGELISPQTYLNVAEGTTVSSTFIGEAYMGAGLLGVVSAALALGYLAMWWTRKTLSAHSDFGVLLYGSGFFAVVTTMRSLYMLPVALMPILALCAIGWLLKYRRTA
jgi:hypothetical protein